MPTPRSPPSRSSATLHSSCTWGTTSCRAGSRSWWRSSAPHEPDALILLTPVADPQNYGVAELRDGTVVRLVEKPAEPRTDLALVGVYMFTPAIHDAARAISPSARGELEITDAIQHLVDSGMRVEPHVVEGWWKDTGRLDDMLEANRLILDNIEPRMDGELVDSRVDGRVVIETGARLERSNVRGPAMIGAGTRLVDAYVGPYTRSARAARSSRPRSSTPSCCRARRCTTSRGGWSPRCWAATSPSPATTVNPAAYRFMVGDNSEISIL